MSQEALIAIVTQETAEITDPEERLHAAIDMALRLLGVPLIPPSF